MFSEGAVPGEPVPSTAGPAPTDTTPSDPTRAGNRERAEAPHGSSWGGSPANEPLLVAQGIVKRFGGFRALDRLNLTIRAGEILGLVGPNGSGKTTAINVISGLLLPDEGDVLFAGEVLTRLPAHAHVHRGMNRTFQVPRPFRGMTVRQNVEVAATYGGHSRDRIDEFLASTGLVDLATRQADTLNSSQQKRLDLARALATEPKLLLVDEIAAGLSAQELETLGTDLKRIAASGIALIVVEHLMGFLGHLTDHVIVMNAGREIFEGSLDQAALDPVVVEVFLGGSLDASLA